VCDDACKDIAQVKRVVCEGLAPVFGPQAFILTPFAVVTVKKIEIGRVKNLRLSLSGLSDPSPPTTNDGL
jgi:hypothetical protein